MALRSLTETRPGTPALGQSVRRPAVRRSVWVVADQGLSSLTNVGVTIVIARSATPDAFGAFGIAFTVYALVLVVTRAVVAQPLAIRFSAQEPDRREIAAAAGAAALLGIVAGTAMVGGGLLVGHQVGGMVALVGAFLPAVLVQDVWRFTFFTVARPRLAVVNDLVWAVSLVAAGAVALLAEASVGWLVAAWAGTGTLAAVVGAWQAGVRPSADGWRYLRRHGELGGRLAVEVVSESGSTQLALVALGGIVGPAGVGAIRGARVVFGLFHMTLVGLMTTAVPEGSRLRARRPAALRPVLAAMSAVLVVVALAWGLVLAGLPAAWGRALLGETWPATRDLLPAATMTAVGAGVASGAVGGLHVLAAAGASMRVGLMGGLVTLGAALGGGALAGVQGGAWGLCLGTWAYAVGGWCWFLRARGGERRLEVVPDG
jgi:O-antigen/teichoic acid export membrane protein